MFELPFTLGHLAVLGDHDTFAGDTGHLAVYFAFHHCAGILRQTAFHAGGHQRSFCLQQRHRLPLHVRAHERAVRVIMLEEWNDRGRYRNELFRTHVHVVHVFRQRIDKVALAAAGHRVRLEHALIVDRRVGLSHDIIFLGIRRQVIELLRHPALHHLAVRRLDKAKLIHARKGRQTGDQTDVRAFRRFHRANAAVMARVHVTHLKARTLARQAARAQRGQAPLVGRLRQRINLIHELAELAAPKEIADHRAERLGIDQLGGRHRVRLLIKERHTLLHQTLRTGEAHAALVGHQLAHCANTPAAEVINVVQHALAHLELEQITRSLEQIVLGENARVIGILETKLLPDLVATHTAEIVPFGIEKQALEQRAAVGHRGRIPGAQAAVNFLQGLLLIVSRILLHALDDESLVARDIHHLHLLHAHSRHLLQHRLGQRLERTGHDHVFLLIHGILHQHQVGEVAALLTGSQRQLLDVVKHLEDFLIRALRAVVLEEA